jgi:hypothetical protein
MSKSGWKFLVIDQSHGLVVRNMTSEFLAYETSKPFSNYLVKPIPFTKHTARFFNEDINDKIMVFDGITYKLEEIYNDPPESYLDQRNLFISFQNYINKINGQVMGRLFEISNTEYPEIDTILKRELEKVEQDSNYSSKLLIDYADSMSQPYNKVISELKIYKEEQELRLVRALGKMKKFIRAINYTEAVEEMEEIYQTFLSEWTLDRIQ